MPDQETSKEPPVLLIIAGYLTFIGAVVWLVEYFFKLNFVLDWLTLHLGGWAIPVGILLPGFIVGWILKRVFE
jgi:hypothetical protein